MSLSAECEPRADACRVSDAGERGEIQGDMSIAEEGMTVKSHGGNKLTKIQIEFLVNISNVVDKKKVDSGGTVILVHTNAQI